MEERMRSSIETRFSSFEEKMLGLLKDFRVVKMQPFAEFVGDGMYNFQFGTVQHFGCVPTDGVTNTF